MSPEKKSSAGEPELREPVLPVRAGEDTDAGWGERPAGTEDDDDERFLRERPPHW